LSDTPTPQAAAAELRWRIPTAGDPALFKLGIAQVGLATLVAALIILLTAPAEWRGLALAGLIPLAVFVAYRRWLKYQRSQSGDDNLRLDSRGLFWLDPTGQQQGFERGTVLGFRIAREADTLRPVPALTLHLTGDFESQPIELHPPATPEAVRSLLVSEWQVPERPAAPANDREYDLAIDVYSECHDDYQEWHLEGTSAALNELFAAIDAAAALPLPPVGAKPLGRTLLLRRRAASRLLVQHDRQTRIGDDTIAGTTEVLHELARLGTARSAGVGPAATLSSATDPKFDLSIRRGDTWTFHLHVREV
jgi:hypothetical protein